MRALCAAALVALAAQARAEPSGRELDFRGRVGFQAGEMDGHLKVAYEAGDATEERRELRWRAGYARGYARGRLEARSYDAKVMIGWGIGLALIGAASVAVGFAFYTSPSVRYEDVFPFSVIVGASAWGLAAQEVAMGLPILIGGIVKWARAERDLAELGRF